MKYGSTGILPGNKIRIFYSFVLILNVSFQDTVEKRLPGQPIQVLLRGAESAAARQVSDSVISTCRAAEEPAHPDLGTPACVEVPVCQCQHSES